MIYETAEQAQQACREWQKILRLQDWDIKVKIVRQDALRNLDDQANVNCCLANKQALIKLVDPIDYPRDTEWEQDHERSLVHELLHLHFWGFADKERETEEEQAVCALASAFVRLKAGDADEQPN
jgi:hypothetical protein